jgi:hypothetical protein
VDDKEKHDDPKFWPITVKFTKASSSFSFLSDVAAGFTAKFASMNISSYEDFVNLEAKALTTVVDTAKSVTTPENAKMGVIGLLGFAGVFHAIPGPLLKKQSEMMGIPQWFIFCAGLLMICTAGLYYFDELYGVVALSVCMGGAGTTAALMPKLLDRPGGMIFSSLTLLAGIWSYCATTYAATLSTTPMELIHKKEAMLCGGGYMFGVLGRLFAPKILKGLFEKKEAPKAKEETPKPEVKAPEIKKPEVGAAMTPKAKAGSASRLASPGAKKASKKNN